MCRESRLRATECAGRSQWNTLLQTILSANELFRDAVSRNQDFIIDYHPKCENLVIATAGSFHSMKFLPTIGKNVVQEDIRHPRGGPGSQVGMESCQYRLSLRDVRADPRHFKKDFVTRTTIDT